MGRKTSAAKDMVGFKVGLLKVKERIGVNKYRFATWDCICECGNLTVQSTNTLLSGRVQSCGCLKKQKATTHGKSKHPLYKVWLGMMSRCYVESSGNYYNYGGRGILVSEDWMNFDAFYNDMIDGFVKGITSIDRMDVQGHYSKENCKWANSKEQSRNKRNTTFIEFNGEKKALCDWAEITGVSRTLIQYRLRNGWSIQDALYKPVEGRIKRK